MGALWAAGRGEGWSRIDIKREKDRKTAIFEEESEKIASFPLFLLFVSPGRDGGRGQPQVEVETSPTISSPRTYTWDQLDHEVPGESVWEEGGDVFLLDLISNGNEG